MNAPRLLTGKERFEALYRQIRALHPSCSYHPDPTKGTGGHGTQNARRAVELARAYLKAENLGLEVEWDYEDRPWDGDGKPPSYHMRAHVSQVGKPRVWWASLGGIGLNSMEDDYRYLVEYELLELAVEAYEEEEERRKKVCPTCGRSG